MPITIILHHKNIYKVWQNIFHDVPAHKNIYKVWQNIFHDLPVHKNIYKVWQNIFYDLTKMNASRNLWIGRGQCCLLKVAQPQSTVSFSATSSTGNLLRGKFAFDKNSDPPATSRSEDMGWLSGISTWCDHVIFLWAMVCGISIWCDHVVSIFDPHLMPWSASWHSSCLIWA